MADKSEIEAIKGALERQRELEASRHGELLQALRGALAQSPTHLSSSLKLRAGFIENDRRRGTRRGLPINSGPASREDDSS
jgi:hypothetical protein